MISKTSERIRDLREQLGVTQEQLGTQLEFAPGTISKWERSAQPIGKNSLIKYAQFFHVTVDYLLGLTDDPKAFIPPDFNGEYEMNEDGEYEPTAKKIINDADPVLEDFLEIKMIPVLSPEHTACCGSGIPTMDITSGDWDVVTVPTRDLGRIDKERKPFAVIADGDSMTAWGIHNGSKVAINPAEDIRDWDIALVCYQDKLMLKKVVFRKGGSVDLLSSDGGIIKVTAEDNNPETFAIWGKAMSEISRLRHGM